MHDAIHARIEALRQMTVSQLQVEWRRVMGEEPRSRNRVWMWRRLAWGIQAREYGGLSERAKRRIEELIPLAEAWMPIGKRAIERRMSPTPLPKRDPRLPKPGTVLTRSYKGRTLAVAVLEDGFEFDGRQYPSLTAIAKAVTGSHWNGMHFFGLKRRETA
ncbi:MAG: DUF2924 domain-containing protein [Acidobacteria bacterium]|nr:DUF2924 domain-containing protein [Acidobacteriota bacterium]